MGAREGIVMTIYESSGKNDWQQGNNTSNNRNNIRRVCARLGRKRLNSSFAVLPNART